MRPMKRLMVAAQRAEKLERDLAAARLELRASLKAAHESGESISELARRLEISRTRVRQLLEESGPLESNAGK